VVHNNLNYSGFGLCPSSGILNNTAFRKLDLFPSSDEEWEQSALTGPLGATLNDCASNMLCSVEYWTTENGNNLMVPNIEFM
jgi:hypothetical protein